MKNIMLALRQIAEENRDVDVYKRQQERQLKAVNDMRLNN